LLSTPQPLLLDTTLVVHERKAYQLRA
jgi:hypothetical protein